MTYIILAGVAFAILCLLLYLGLREETLGEDKVMSVATDKAPRNAKPRSTKSAAPQRKPSKPTPSRKTQETSKDDLTRIEGVGPKIATLLTNADIKSFEQLATVEVDALKSIVMQGGVRFREKVAVTWSEQAKLAADGQWDALTKLQAKLKGGVH